jgi:2,3-bisphosphoglycerate-independent phosphoglycerate mutase
MKGMFIILDGIGDLPHKALGEKTPLEVANTPNLDFLSSRGELGYMYSIRPGFIPESDDAIVSLFGNKQISSTRGQLETKGAGLELTRGDLAMRANFATIDSIKSGKIIDRRAGRTLTTSEAQALAKEINKIKLPVKFIFKPTIQHRGIFVLKGGFSEDISGNDNTYIEGKSKETDKITFSHPLDDEENSQYTANIVNEFIEKSHEVLKNHPINKERERKGFPPANYLMLRGPGTEVPKLNQYKKWMSISYMPLEIGFSKLCGMKVFSFNYPKLKGLDAYENLWNGLKTACNFSIKTIKKNHKKFDYVYLHIKETDLPGHDNKPFEKKEMIEYLDKNLFGFVKKFSTQNNLKVLVTADHSTPCKLKLHTADPVPVLLYNNAIPREKRFCEKQARIGKLGKIMGIDLLKKLGFTK